MRWLIIVLASVFALVLALGAALWVYSGSDGSLATTLRLLTPLLPAGQSLELHDVLGSVRQGGRIGALRWAHDGLEVQAQEVTLHWRPKAILQRQLHLTELTIGALRIDDQRPARADAAPEPPTQLTLPLTVDALVQVADLQWTRSTTIHVEQIKLHYTFDSYLHSIDKGESHFSSNKYNFSGNLQANAPMTLTVQASGQVNAQVPGGAPLTLAAKASLAGDIAGRDAQLTLQAELTPQRAGDAAPQANSPRKPKPMRASLSAQLAPWQRQPVRSAQARWQALDLAVLWAQAPRTRLDGQARVTPQGAAQWQANIQVTNTISGPWNQHSLPVASLQAELGYGAGGWLLRSLQARGAGGSVSATAQLTDPTTWQINGQLQDIDPAAIDTRLDSIPLGGTVSARQSLAARGSGAAAGAPGHGPIAFAVALQATPKTPRIGRTALQTLQLRKLDVQGLWSDSSLKLETLKIETQDAQLHGPLQVDLAHRAVQGALALQGPGLVASVQGHMSRSDGQGQLAVQVSNAAQATQWLARWPQLAGVLGQRRWLGQAELNAQWHGGWQSPASALQLSGKLRSAQLGWSERDAADAVTLRQVELDLSGSTARWSVAGRGQITARGRQLDWQSHVTGARLGDGAWQARVDDLQIALHSQDQAQNVWQLALAPASTPTLLTWRPGVGAGQWAVSAGSAQLRGPTGPQGQQGSVTKPARMDWQAIDWSATGWQSQGQIAGLPLVWFDALAHKSLSDLGLGSDMTLSGQWQISQARRLQAALTLERSAGDLFLQTGDSAGSAIAADMREAWLQVNLNEGQLAASLRWDSTRAGKALLAFSTQVQSASGAWRWNGDVPVAGSAQLQLPPMDVWSALAPPGWRLRGTVNTHVDLSGTLNQPQWSGRVQARDLAVRSVVHGIDFNQGQLDALLHDQQLDLTSLTLRGAGTGKSEGGLLRLGGSLFWRPDASAPSLRQQVQMALQAELQSLRLNTRPDRRLVASGKLDASYQSGTLALRGALSADHALFTLPEDNAPSLGDDVRVRPRQGSATSAVKSAASTRPAIDVSVKLDLGPDFQVRGRGMETRLAGTLTLSAAKAQAPALTGVVRSEQGSYRAYGQKLDIERGVLRFTGAVDNPALDILAIRPKLSQRVGVQISGSALSPVVSLYAEPDLPDAEKLAWLVLGRSTGGGGAEAALMQQAAMALLGGNGKGLSESMSAALGLDELSIRGGTQASTGDGTASAASVTLGKRLSSDFYVAYERSLNSATGVFSIFFDLSKRLTLRAQTGEQSAVDLIYTMRYD